MEYEQVAGSVRKAVVEVEGGKYVESVVYAPELIFSTKSREDLVTVCPRGSLQVTNHLAVRGRRSSSACHYHFDGRVNDVCDAQALAMRMH
jgi:hypothetical protein